MGDHNLSGGGEDSEALRAFTQRLLNDLRALEYMLSHDWFESGIRRIGAEQEAFLVDRDLRPAPVALEVLRHVGDPHYVTEVALFNIEMNLDPLALSGDALRRMEAQNVQLVEHARATARAAGHDVVLTGILPTIRRSDLGLENMTPHPRYAALNRAMTRLRGKDYEVTLKGVDELSLKHGSVMLESCNASFQTHLQVAPAEFARFYNIAQLIAAPVLAVATNSPLLLGRRLWHETRIALFQQSVDTRSEGQQSRGASPRVDFGRRWIRDSVTEIHREDITRYRVLIASEPEEDPFRKLARGEVPELRALRLHNGTIYRWNRACYGVMNGKPHLRIENRVMPSGPTPRDQMANGAFWWGLMVGAAAEYGEVAEKMSFDDAKANFVSAARLGLGAQFQWLGDRLLPVQQLVLDELLPLAHRGLVGSGVDESDADLYLRVVEERVRSGRTGSRWLLRSFDSLRGHGTEGERLCALTAATIARQCTNEPVARWEPARLEEGGGWERNYLKVEHFMTADFPTVHEEDPLDLAASVMVWEGLRHLPVTDGEDKLVGLLSYRAILRAASGDVRADEGETLSVGRLMRRDPVVISPDASTLDAIAQMRSGGYGCLPVVRDGHLVGLVTARNLMDMVAELLDEKLRD